MAAKRKWASSMVQTEVRKAMGGQHGGAEVEATRKAYMARAAVVALLV